MNETIDKLKKEDVENFIREYISEYRTFLEEKYPQTKNDFPFYTGYPFDVKAYVSDESTLITYKHNAPTLKIEVTEVDTLPDWRLLKEVAIHVSTNTYFFDKPQDVAIREFLDLLYHEEYEKDQAELYEKYHEDIKINDTIERYLKYFDKSHNIKKETLEKHRTDIYNAIKLVSKHKQNFSGFLIAGCETLKDVVYELNKDIESSIFLSVHANYHPANTLLRRWLEVTFIAVNFDFNLKRYKDENQIESYNKLLKERDKWLRNPEHKPFGRERKKLLDDKTNNKATQLLNLTNPNKKISFNNHVTNIYEDLSQHVHYGGGSPIAFDKMTFNFVDYDEKSFIEWYNKLNQIYEIYNIIIRLKFPKMIDISEKYKNTDLLSFPILTDTQISKLKEWKKSHELI